MRRVSRLWAQIQRAELQRKQLTALVEGLEATRPEPAAPDLLALSRRRREAPASPAGDRPRRPGAIRGIVPHHDGVRNADRRRR